MAACEFYRLDSLNTTNTTGKFAARIHWSDTDQKFFVLWREINGIRFAKYDPATHTASDEVAVNAPGTNNVRDQPILVAISDTHLFSIHYASSQEGFSNQTVACESTDGGATWSSPPTAISATQNRPMAAYWDGTNIVVIVVAQNSGSGALGAGDYGYHKSVGATNAWSAVTSFYNSGGLGSQTPGTADTSQPQQERQGLYMSTANIGFFAGLRCTDATPTLNKLDCWYTTDGWANSTQVNIKTAVAAFTGGIQVRVIGSRVWLMYNDPDANNICGLAYTDDFGATWSDVGTPTAIANEIASLGITPNGTYDFAIGLNIQDDIVICHGAQTLNPGTYLTYRASSADAENDVWVVADLCSYVPTVDPRISSTGMTAQLALDPNTGRMHRLVTATIQSSGTKYTLQFLDFEDVPREPDENPQQPVSEASGADDNSLYLRNCLALGGGWSAHTVSVAYFMDWDEGDRETGAQVNMLLAASPSMDPAIQDPELIAAFTRLDADGYTSRTYTATSSDATTIREDPFSMRVYTKKYAFKQAFERNVARGFLVTWQRNGGSPYEERNFPNPDMAHFEVWVDDRHLQTIRLWNTGEDRLSRFFPLNTWGNVGEEFQIRIQDGSPWEFHIDAIGMMYMPKKIRG